MPLNRNNTRTFHRTLYAGQLEMIRLLKRNDNQKQGTVTPYILFDCRRSIILKTGETIQGDMNSNHACTWHIPIIELERVGVHYLNPLDRIVQLEGTETGWVWQPEATTLITTKLFGNHFCIDCLRTDPPTNVTPHG